MRKRYRMSHYAVRRATKPDRDRLDAAIQTARNLVDQATAAIQSLNQAVSDLQSEVADLQTFRTNVLAQNFPDRVESLETWRGNVTPQLAAAAQTLGEHTTALAALDARVTALEEA